MNRCTLLILCTALCLTSACQQRAKFAAPEPEAARSLAVPGAAAPAKRYIAVRRRIEIETAESDLQKSWESIAAFCGTLRCEIVSSNIANRANGAAPSANLSLRIAPEDLPKLLDRLGKSGALVRQTTDSEDKTATVIDVEAKIKNLTEYRDSLRALLGRSAASLKDLIEVRRELTEVQSQLDSETTRRKALADETEKVALEIQFSVRGSQAGRSGLGKIGTALSDSLSTLGESAAALITFLFAALPWAIATVAVVWFVRKILRRRRKTA
jgi:hypothetical protein